MCSGASAGIEGTSNLSHPLSLIVLTSCVSLPSKFILFCHDPHQVLCSSSHSPEKGKNRNLVQRVYRHSAALGF